MHPCRWHVSAVCSYSSQQEPHSRAYATIYHPFQRGRVCGPPRSCLRVLLASPHAVLAQNTEPHVVLNPGDFAKRCCGSICDFGLLHTFSIWHTRSCQPTLVGCMAVPHSGFSSVSLMTSDAGVFSDTFCVTYVRVRNKGGWRQQEKPSDRGSGGLPDSGARTLCTCPSQSRVSSVQSEQSL